MAIQGRYSLAYQGVNAPTPPNFIFETRAPTTSDYIGYDIGTIWLNQITTPGATPVYSTSLAYMLVATARNYGTWIPLGGGGGGATPVINTVTFNTPGTFSYIPSLGISQVSVELLGGGCGGDGFLKSISGSAGGYCKRLFSAAQIGASQTVTIGAGSIGGTSSVSAIAGGTSTFGAFMTANGGQIGSIAAPITFVGLGGTATGGDLNVQGQAGNMAFNTVGDAFQWYVWSGGANTIYGSGGATEYAGGTNNNLTKNDATGYGSGGSSSFQYSVSPSYPCGNGAPGLCLITEFF